jgi:hypothetical protein
MNGKAARGSAKDLSGVLYYLGAPDPLQTDPNDGVWDSKENLS